MWSVTAKSKKTDKGLPVMLHPLDLPIYGIQSADDSCEYVEKAPSRLQCAVRDARVTVQGVWAQYEGSYQRLQQIWETGKAHSAGSLEYLKDETNLVPRATAITAGGLAGLLLAALRRRGIIRRLMYTAVGLAVPTAVCYPAQTSQYARWSYDQSLMYSAVAYNFVTGVKPGVPAGIDSTRAPSGLSSAHQPPTASRHVVISGKPQMALPATAGDRYDHGQSRAEDADLYTTRSSV